MTCTGCGAEIGPDYTADADGIFCTNCVDHPDSPADGLRVFVLDD